MFPGIENGCTVVRQAGGGLSLVTDYRGKIRASFDFYTRGAKFWMADIVTGHVPTVYSYIGDAFGYLCTIITAGVGLCLVAQFFLRRKSTGLSKISMAQAAW